MNIVKELRKKKGIQQKELAIEIGVTQPTVSEWESGKKDPSGDRLKALAAYFDVDELVILGKGYADQLARAPVTDEAKIVSGGLDKLSKEERERVLNVLRAMFANRPDLFE